MDAKAKIKDRPENSWEEGQDVSEAEMDRLLSARHDEIEALLDEARTAKARGEFAPLESLQAFLRRARSRLKSAR
jgi:hypothetical protein